MLQAMYSGISAIEAQQTSLDVIGNNIANVNTTAYKAGRVTFEDQLSQTIQGASTPSANVGGTNPQQVGLGVRVSSIDTVMAQGGLQSTSKPTDMAIQGNGYFMLGDTNGTGVSYTRDGSFSLDSSGNLVNSSSGAYVLGWKADANGKIDSTPANHVRVQAVHPRRRPDRRSADNQHGLRRQSERRCDSLCSRLRHRSRLRDGTVHADHQSLRQPRRAGERDAFLHPKRRR